MKGYFVCAGCGKVVGTRGRGPIRCSDGHKGLVMDFVGEGEEGKKEAAIRAFNTKLRSIQSTGTPLLAEFRREHEQPMEFTWNEPTKENT